MNNSEKETEFHKLFVLFFVFHESILHAQRYDHDEDSRKYILTLRVVPPGGATVSIPYSTCIFLSVFPLTNRQPDFFDITRYISIGNDEVSMSSAITYYWVQLSFIYICDGKFTNYFPNNEHYCGKSCNFAKRYQ